MFFRRLAVLSLAVVAMPHIACTSSSTPPATTGNAGGGSNTASSGSASSTTGSGGGPSTASASTGSGGATAATSASSGAGGATAATSANSGAGGANVASSASSAASGAGGGAACNIDGTWVATQYACAGETPQSFPALFSWTIVDTGNTGSFTQAQPGCSNTATGTISCVGDVLTYTPTQPTQCTPANCLSMSECDAVAPGASWTLTNPSATTMVLVMIEPSPITTCTSMGKQNPLTVYWQKQ